MECGRIRLIRKLSGVANSGYSIFLFIGYYYELENDSNWC